MELRSLRLEKIPDVQTKLNYLFCAGFLPSPFPAIFYSFAAIFIAGSLTTIFLRGLEYYFSCFHYRMFFLLAMIQTAGWILNAVFEYRWLGYNYYDTGSFSNPISNFVAGFGYFNSELQVHGLADHFTPNLLLLAPFYAIFNSGMVLIFTRILFYVFGFYTLNRYCLYKKLSISSRSFILFFWTINLGLNNYMGYEFQPSSLIVPLVFLLFEFADKKKYIAFCLLGLFSVGFKENAVFMLVSLGFYQMLFQKEIKAGLTTCFLACLTGFLILRVITPQFSEIGSIHQDMIDPFCCIREKATFILKMLAACGFVLIFHPKAFLVMLPSLAVSLLGNRPGAFSFTFHYQDLPIAVCFGLLVTIFQANENGFWPAIVLKKKTLQISALLLFFLPFLLNSRSSFSFAASQKPFKESQEAAASIRNFREDYYKLTYWKTSTIYAQDCLAFYLSDIYTIRSLKSIQQIDLANGNYFIILSDMAKNRWPIYDDYESLKTQLRKEVLLGKMTENKSYYPLLIFEKHN